MKKLTRHIGAIAAASTLVFPMVASAQSAACLEYYQSMVEHMEAGANTHESDPRTNACRKQDQIELALNAAGSAREVCTGEALKSVNTYIVGLTGLLAKAVHSCGH